MKKIRKLAKDLGIIRPYRELRRKYFPNVHDKNLENLKVKRKSFYSQFVKKGGICIDVGANFGNRTEIFLDIGSKVVAVEPQEKCQNFLKKKFGDRIHLIPKGLNDRGGVETMYISDTSVLSTFNSEWVNELGKGEGRFSKHEWKKKVEIQMTTLSNLIKEFGKPDFIKIDVEGYEYEVLKGLNEEIPMISFEYTVPEKLNIVLDCINHLYDINPNIKMNYSLGEGMEWALDTWLSYDETIKEVNSKRFLDSFFGDVYIKMD